MNYAMNIVMRLLKQMNKGHRKYGQPLELNGRPALEALDYLAEELVDALFYIEELKAKLEV